jgi:hypothetical protein
MGLEADALRIFVAFGGWFADQDVAQFVVEGLKTMLETEVLEIGRYFLLMFRGAWNLHYFTEIAPYGGRLKI